MSIYSHGLVCLVSRAATVLCRTIVTGTIVQEVAEQVSEGCA
jgi:hypothetical protein